MSSALRSPGHRKSTHRDYEPHDRRYKREKIVPLLIAVRLLDGPGAQLRDVAEGLSFTLTATLAVAWRFMHDVVAE